MKITMCAVAIAMVSLGAEPLGFRTPGQQNGPPADSPGRGDLNRADPCALVPDPPGEANGIEKHCALGGSGGVGRGDFNNDGIGDLAVGVPDETRVSRVFDVDCFCFITTNHRGAGAVNIIYGSTNGLRATGSQVLDQGQIGGVSDNAHFGRALAAGRFRGAGFASDLAVGAPGVRRNNSTVGAIYVFFSNAQGRLNGTPDQVFFASDFSSVGSLLGGNPMRFPEHMSMVWGDFNGDGVGDLAAEVVNSGVQDSRNAVLVLYGTAGSGLSRSTYDLLVVDEGLNPGNSPFDPPTGCGTQIFCATARGGDIALAASDLDGDARDELLIGAPNCREIDDDRDIVGGTPIGCVAIVRGRESGFDRFFGWDVLRPEDNDLDDNAGFGQALAVGDFDGSGVKDVAVGAPLTLFDTAQVPDGAGSVRVFADVQPPFSQDVIFAQSTLLTQNTGVVNPAAEGNDRFGAALAANDFTGDGVTDLAVGVPGESTGSTTGHGEVDVFHGALGNGLTAGPRFVPQGLLPPVGVVCCFGGAAFGSSLTSWNFGAGAPADLAIGSPFFTLARFTNNTITATVAGAGGVLTLYGQPTVGLVFPVMQFWTQNPGFPVCVTGFCFITAGSARAGNHFGAAVY